MRKRRKLPLRAAARDEDRIADLELEVENLRAAQVALEISRDRYAHFFDFAPQGYLVFGIDGMIREINLTASTMIGLRRIHLIDHSLWPFITPESRPVFREHLNRCGSARRDETVSTDLFLRSNNSARQTQAAAVSVSACAGIFRRFIIFSAS